MSVVYIVHGGDWKAHKYLRKEKLSDGTYRYYYPYNLPARLRGEINYGYSDEIESPINAEHGGEEYQVYKEEAWRKSDDQIRQEMVDIVVEELGKTVKSMVLNKDLSAAKKLASNIRGRVGDIEVSSGQIVVTGPKKLTSIGNGSYVSKSYYDSAEYSNSLRYEKKWEKNQYKRDNRASHQEK